MPVATATALAPPARAQRMSCGVSPMTTTASGSISAPVLGLVPRVRDRDQVVALDGVVGERPPREVAPHVEGGQLDLGRGAEVAGEQRQPDVVAAGERVEQRPHAGQQAAAPVARLLDLLAQRGAVRLAERDRTIDVLVRRRPAWVSASRMMMRSVRPARSTFFSASSRPWVSAKARVIAREPAPPVRTSVPSISNSSSRT